MASSGGGRRTSHMVAALVAVGVVTATGVSSLAPAAGSAAAVPTGVTVASSTPPTRHIVQVRQGVTAAAVVRAHLGALADVTLYSDALDGFAATFDAATRARLVADGRVISVMSDQRVSIPADVTQMTPDPLRARTIQTAPPWGLDRIDQRALPLSGTYRYEATGAGVTAYVVDTGIRADHTEFVGRVHPGAYTVNDRRGTADCDGHGTHVAGTLGGRTFGVAKAVTLVPVRVLDCEGFGLLSDVIAGIDWAIADHDVGEPAVMNLSLGVGYSPVFDAAVAAAVDDGIVAVVAAGNEGGDACESSPGSEPTALTVAASNRKDQVAKISNRGPCVDLIAPGVKVLSAGLDSATSTVVMTGTSMAAPHVAGMAALMLSADPTATPAEISERLLAAATTGQIAGAAGTPLDRLLHLGPEVVEAVPPGLPPTPPATAVALDSRGFTPQTALPVTLGAQFYGDTSSCFTACGPQYWRLAGSLLPGDDVWISWGADLDTRVCLSSGTPGGTLCDLSEPDTAAAGDVGASRLRVTAKGTAPIATAYLVFDPLDERGGYWFSWDTLLHRVRLAVQAPRQPIDPVSARVEITARLVDGSPVSDGTEVRIVVRRPSGRYITSEFTVDGRVWAELLLGSTDRGTTVHVRASIAAGYEARSARTPWTPIRIRR